MSNDLVVGVVIALMVVASVSYMKGISSCGCKGCTRCKSGCGSNVTVDEGGCDCCEKKD